MEQHLQWQRSNTCVCMYKDTAAGPTSKTVSESHPGSCVLATCLVASSNGVGILNSLAGKCPRMH